MKIRPRLPEDIPGCVILAQLVHEADSYPVVLPDDDFVSFLVNADALGAWVLEDGGSIVGHVALHKSTTREAIQCASAFTGVPRDSLAAISRLMVAPRSRRSGMGKWLLGTSAHHARSLGRTPMLDVVASSTGAVRFYEECGWKCAGWVRSTFRSGESIDELVYVDPAVPTSLSKLHERPLVADGDDIQTERLSLHAVDVLEAERIVAQIPGPTDAWADDFPFEGDLGAVGHFLRTSAAEGEQRPFGPYRITRLVDVLAIGGIGFKGQPRDGAVEIGYGLVASARGHGYAAEALGALVSVAADHGLSKVIAESAVDNIASQRTLARAGFQLVSADAKFQRYERDLDEA